MVVVSEGSMVWRASSENEVPPQPSVAHGDNIIVLLYLCVSCDSHVMFVVNGLVLSAETSNC